ncbi:hypothetical protein GCM10010168_50530 [Actinoplanes ianthinogenes]|uniref:H repeat-associated protein N-terminal domain-containing protein n=1 Tax=Actinoplanes ianthinogenes TaxID=122358 RepID=A0ABM7M3D1_9ACTN|nr:hypothetical protein [Actinoplanes ianthinogenes]BCJ46104.1 hypothetical protein Aiant_67610 [Actinoplanes ianthinogenes]GGR26252.1 hypothetical protein GCM10010168_50530 [Actinoplanes ianthinogenes]
MPHLLHAGLDVHRLDPAGCTLLDIDRRPRALSIASVLLAGLAAAIAGTTDTYTTA